MLFGWIPNWVVIVGLGLAGGLGGYFTVNIRALVLKGPTEQKWSLICHGLKDNGQAINLAILYVTAAIIITSVVTNWPPEGQQTPDWLADVVFFTSIPIAAFIFGRTSRIIAGIEFDQAGGD